METIVKTHVGAYGIIIKDDKIALVKKARGGYKGKLDLPGGGIEHFESPVDALKRANNLTTNLLSIGQKLILP